MTYSNFQIIRSRIYRTNRKIDKLKLFILFLLFKRFPIVCIRNSQPPDYLNLFSFKAPFYESSRTPILAPLQAKRTRSFTETEHTIPLVPGIGMSARAAMHIIERCKQNMPRTNLAFRQMFASRQIFPPKKNINKFATGGIAEECITQLFCDIGLDCINRSADTNVIDLEIQVPIVLFYDNVQQIVPLHVSIKNSGKLTSPPILENYRGQKRQDIRPLPPTFIVYTETDAKRARIVYLDEEILRQGFPELSDEEFCAEIYSNGDSSLTFKSGFLVKFLPRLPAEYIVDAEYPEDITGMAESNFCKLALAEVVRQLGNSTTLFATLSVPLPMRGTT